MGTLITVEATINSSIEKVWNKWTNPDDIIKWNHASDDWHTLKAENNLKVGEKFNYRMEAKDGSMGFDFWGTYSQIKPLELIESTLGDGRKMKISFKKDNGKTIVTEIFEAESVNSIELQQQGWQAILNNFKKYVEQ